MNIKDFLHTYSSNTLAASGNQTLFYSDEGKYTGRIFYKIRIGGSWLYKAKQNDAVSVCFGVNDILRGRSAEEVKLDLKMIVGRLQDNGVKVLVQTPPPFDYSGKFKDEWDKVCEFILNELPTMGCEVFDNRHILGKKDSINMAEYGGHPNSEGCKLWGEALYPAVRALLEKV